VTSSLAAEGERKIAWVSEWMPVLNSIRDRLRDEGGVAGRRIAVILPVEPKTAYLAACLAEAGAEVSVAFQGVMVHDDVAAGLASRGVEVFARHGSTRDEELRYFAEVLARRPEVVIDDRADVIRLAHTTHPEVLETLVGASEETTSGVVALRAMEADGTLRVPCVAANDARCKFLFDNRYVRTFFRAVPGMQEWALLGKAWFHTTEHREDGSPRFDVVILDAPATGHGLDMLRVLQHEAPIVFADFHIDEERRMATLSTERQEAAAALV